MKRYEWELKDGRKVTLEAEYTETVQNKIVDLDGDICDTVKREIRTSGTLTVYIDGVKFDTCTQPNFWQTIDTGITGIKKIWGIKQIAFTEDRAAEIEAFFAEVFAEGKNEEAEQIRSDEKAAAIADEIAEAERVVAKAEAQKDIPSMKEARRRMREYNNIVNEGGSGYVPYIVSMEEYEHAKQKLEKLRA